MTETKLTPEIPELEFLLRNSRICSEKQIAGDSGYLNGFKKCGRCNGTEGNARVLECEGYKTDENGEGK